MPPDTYTELLASDVTHTQLRHHAESSFESVMDTFRHPEEILIRALWNAETYLERWPFRDVKSPIDIEHGLLLVEVFMPHYVLELVELLRLADDSREN